jgi:GNAT superfamily N-acetyltransferase
MGSFIIRNYLPEDAEQIGKIDATLKLLVLYHGDFEQKNMFCAVGHDGCLYAAGLIMPSEWCSALSMEKEKKFVHYLNFELHFVDGYRQKEIADALIERLIIRGCEMKAQYPKKRMALAQYMDADQPEQLDYFLGHGFFFYDSVAEFRFDLSKEIPNYPKPEGIKLKIGKLNHTEELEKYHRAEMEAFSGISWSMNLIKWMQGAPDLCNFCAYYGDEFAGNTSTWTVTAEQGVTENVFVAPKWQKNGIARFVISEALRHLKSQGKKVATLGTQGDNRKAIRLYHELGYELYHTRLRVGFELE